MQNKIVIDRVSIIEETSFLQLGFFQAFRNVTCTVYYSLSANNKIRVTPKKHARGKKEVLSTQVHKEQP